MIIYFSDVKKKKKKVHVDFGVWTQSLVLNRTKATVAADIGVTFARTKYTAYAFAIAHDSLQVR